MDIPIYQISEFNYPSYLTDVIANTVEKQIAEGNLMLWKRMAMILSAICKKIYNDSINDERVYRYRD